MPGMRQQRQTANTRCACLESRPLVIGAQHLMGASLFLSKTKAPLNLRPRGRASGLSKSLKGVQGDNQDQASCFFRGFRATARH